MQYMFKRNGICCICDSFKFNCKKQMTLITFIQFQWIKILLTKLLFTLLLNVHYLFTVAGVSPAGYHAMDHAGRQAADTRGCGHGGLQPRALLLHGGGCRDDHHGFPRLLRRPPGVAVHARYLLHSRAGALRRAGACVHNRHGGSPLFIVDWNT